MSLRNILLSKRKKIVLLFITIFICAEVAFVLPWHFRQLFVVKQSGSQNINSTNSQYTVENQTQWIIHVTVNNGFLDFFVNWYIAFKRLDIRYPVVVMTEDDTSYMRLKKYQTDMLLVERSNTDSITNSTNFNTYYFNVLVARRVNYILNRLRKGENVLHVDIDAVWLKNPFTFFVGDYDMWVASGGPKEINAGLMAIKSSKQTETLIAKWLLSLNEYLQPDQRALNKLEFLSDLKIKYLSMDVFPTGRMLFLNRTVELSIAQRSSLIIFHNNGAYGHQEKLERFQKLGFWLLENGTTPETYMEKLHSDVI